MIASRVPGRRWWLVLLLAAVAATAWHARPPADGDDAIDEVHGGLDGPSTTCRRSFASMLKRSGLLITKVRSGCFGTEIQVQFSIASTGEVTWTRGLLGWPVHRLALSSEQLALVRRLDRLSCGEPPLAEHSSLAIHPVYSELAEDFGPPISPESELGAAVMSMLDEIMDRHVLARQGSSASLDLRLETTMFGAVYRARVTGGRLTVERGRERLFDESLDPGLLIELVDAALEQGTAAGPDEDALGVDKSDLRGELLVHGRSVPLVLARDRSGPFDLIRGAIAKARFCGFDVHTGAEEGAQNRD